MLHRNRACKFDAQGLGLHICYRAYNSDAQQGLRIWCGLQICCTGPANICIRPANMMHRAVACKYDEQGVQMCRTM